MVCILILFGRSRLKLGDEDVLYDISITPLGIIYRNGDGDRIVTSSIWLGNCVCVDIGHMDSCCAKLDMYCTVKKGYILS